MTNALSTLYTNAKDESKSEHHVAYLTPLSHKTRIGEALQQHSSNTLTRLPSPSITVNDTITLRGGGYLNLENHFENFYENILQLHPEIVEPTGGGLADLGFIAMQDLYEPQDAGKGLI